MTKTTKVVKAIRSYQKFNQGDSVKTVTIEGAKDLADVANDKNGDLTLKLNRDKTKVSTVVSANDYLTAERAGTEVTLTVEEQAIINLITRTTVDYLKHLTTDNDLLDVSTAGDTGNVTANKENLKAFIIDVVTPLIPTPTTNNVEGVRLEENESERG